MKSLITILVIQFFLQFQLSAQKGQPAFGKVDKEDLMMTDCEFDKGAAALKLIDWGNAYYDRGTTGISTFKTVLQRRVRIKILKEKGISQADVEIPYYTHNNEEKILKLNANTYNIDAEGKTLITVVKKSSIYSKRINAYHSKMIIAFPEVKVGSIIEYAYTVERETISLNDWHFQGRIPVRYSEYQLRIPQIFRFSVQPTIVDTVEDKHEIIDEMISVSEGVLNTKSLKSIYIMRNLPGIKNEPYMGATKDYMQRLEFQLTQIVYSDSHIEDRSLKWKDVIKNGLNENESFGMQLKKDLNAAKELVEEAKLISDLESRMKFLYNQIRQKFNWDETNDIYTDLGLSKAWETKTGNSADINLLLVKLLKDAGLNAKPMLFSTREHGLVSPLYPFLSQFNTVNAFVEIEKSFFVLNATDKVSHYKLVPEDIANTSGFIVDGENGKWKEILSGKSKYKVMAAVQAEIDSDGLMKGNGFVNCYDYARVQRCQTLITSKEKFNSEYFIKPYPSIKIEDITINNQENDSLPLEQKVKFNFMLNTSGVYRYFTLNIFSDLEENPFIAINRVSDIDFGVHQEYSILGNYTIPEDYEFEGLPESISMTTPDNGIVFKRFIQSESNVLNVKMTLEFKRSFYPANTYAEFASFYKKLFDKLNEQVVIKKKATP